MDGKTGFRRRKKNLLSYKGQEIMESHDCQHSKRDTAYRRIWGKEKNFGKQEKILNDRRNKQNGCYREKKIKQGKSHGWINILEDGDKKHF